MNTQKGFASILLILLGLVVIGGGVYVYNQKNDLGIFGTKENIEISVLDEKNTNADSSEEKDVTDASTTSKGEGDSNKIETNTSAAGKIDSKIITNNPPVTGLSLSQFNQNQQRNIFNSSGNVSFNNGEYVLIEDGDANMSAIVDVPEGGAVITYSYKFLKQGDGDSLNIRFADPDDSKKGLDTSGGQDLAISRRDYLPNHAEILDGKQRITFTLVSEGSTNAVVSIKDIKIFTSEAYLDFLLKQDEAN